MNNQCFLSAKETLQNTFLYYDPVEGTKYRKLNNTMAITSSGFIGGLLMADKPIAGAIAGGVISTAMLWMLNKDKSQKPLNDREISLIRKNLKSKINNNLQSKATLSEKITDYKQQLNDLTNAKNREIEANKILAIEVLKKETKKFEKKFDDQMQKLEAYLLVAGIINSFSHDSMLSTLDDTSRIFIALDNIKQNRDNSYSAIKGLLHTLPAKLAEKHGDVITRMLRSIGPKPVSQKITGPIENKYIIIKDMLNDCIANYNGHDDSIVAAQKVYSIKIKNGKAEFPDFNQFKREMPN